MIGFNAILRNEGIELKDVKLVRHQDTRFSGRPTPYQLHRLADGQFELYQRIQKRPVFKGASILASFVGTPLNETLFVGLYRVRGLGKAPEDLIDPVTGRHADNRLLYDIDLMDKLAEYRDKLVIQWGGAYRAWVQLARKQDKPILEIRRSAGDPPFPGFLEFRECLSGLVSVPMAWRAALSSVGGIYLLTCPKSGKQYVGSAYGASGFWGRWEEYASSGHGGNLRMRELPRSDYQVTVLEVASSSARSEDLIRLEGHWKEKLRSREFGLNAN